MTNINLLPPEIAEKRKTERRRALMGLAAFGAACVVLAVFFVFRLQVAGVSSEVEAAQQKSKRLSDAKAQLQQFADRKQELQKRQKIAADVIDKRVEWSKLLNEISMVTPSDVWLESILGEEGDEGLTFRGFTPDSTPTAESTGTASTDTTEGPVLDAKGHKPVAKFLVRLSMIRDLKDIWLTKSEKTKFEEQGVIQFEGTAKWLTSHAPSSASAPTAPPAATPSSGSSPGG